VRLMTAERLGGAQASGNPAQAAAAAGISTGVGAMIPVIPSVFATGSLAIVLAGNVSLLAHFLAGAAKSLFTLAPGGAPGSR